MNIPDYTQFRGLNAEEGSVGALSELYTGTVSEELNEDFILPDVMPDVKKMLSVIPSVMLTEKSMTEKSVIFSGEVNCNVLYISDTDKLKNVAFAIPFRHEESVGELKDECTAAILPYIGADHTKMLNPRKIGIRMTLQALVRVFGGIPTETKIGGKHNLDDELAMERKTEETPVMTLTTAEKQNINISQDIELDSTNPSIGEIIQCGMKISPFETRIVQGNAEIVAEAVFSCLYESENGNYFTVSKKFQLEESVEIPDAAPESECLTRIYCGAVKTSAQNNSYGERRIIELDSVWSVSVAAMRNDSLVLTRDIYSTEYESANTVETKYISCFNRAYATNFSVNTSRNRAEVDAEKANAILLGDVSANINHIDYDEERKKLILEGVARITEITVTPPGEDTETMDYGKASFEEPFRCEMDVPSYTRNCDTIALCDVLSSRSRLDSGKIYADFEIGIRAIVIENLPQTVTTEAVLDPEKAYDTRNVPPVTLYYPHPGESIWEIAKRYHTTRYAICQANHMDTETQIPDAHVLLIPRGKKKPIYSKII